VPVSQDESVDTGSVYSGESEVGSTELSSEPEDTAPPRGKAGKKVKSRGKKLQPGATKAPANTTDTPQDTPQEKSLEKQDSSQKTITVTPQKKKGDYSFPNDVEVQLAVWLHENPHLWDTTDEAYRDIDLVRQTWQQGADQFDCTGEYLHES